MLKKLAVPFLTLTIAAFGCSSSTTPTPGTGGSGGAAGAAGGKGGGAAGTTGAAGSSAAGTTGTAGSSAAGTTGTAGSSAAGSTGTAGNGAAGTTGTAGSAGGHSGGGAGGAKADAGTSMADCLVTDSAGTDKLSASVFCDNLFAYCSNISGLTLPADKTACMNMYTSSNQEHCRSYHLCWGVEGLSMDGGKGNPMVHCQHTVGINLCQATDASVGN
jgi:hypothetical protein